MENVIPRMKNMLIQARKVITQPYPPSGGAIITKLLSSSALILFLVQPFEVISVSGCVSESGNNAMILQIEKWVKLCGTAIISSKNEKCSILKVDLGTFRKKNKIHEINIMALFLYFLLM